jgi:glucose 1-dehydrogenase
MQEGAPHMRFEEQVILVTGSTRGIGLETAVFFASRGGAVVVHGPEDSEELAHALRKVKSHGPASSELACDLVDSEAIREMFEKIESSYGQLNVLVNNAAVQNRSGFMELSEVEWDRIMAVNLKAPFLCSQYAARLMIGQGGGKIINIGSVHQFHPRRHYAHYTASKGGLLMLTKSMALELAEYNIQVNQVAPGAIATELTDSDRQKKFLEVVPADRVGKTAEIAAMVGFLASSEADYITGASFTVDGGLTLGFCASRPDL